MPRCSALCLLVLCCWSVVRGQHVTVHGQHESYRDIPIHITIAWNPFITVPEYSKVVTCDDNGSFADTFSVSTGRVVQFEAGIHESYLFVEPGIDYEIELPEYREMQYAQRISPYFQPQVGPVKVLTRRDNQTGRELEGRLEVNRRIALFDSTFTAHNREVIMGRRSRQLVHADSMIGETESFFSEDTSRFFRDYRKYRYGILKLNEGRMAPASISRDYLGPTVNDSNPGFIELFRILFTDFFFRYAQASPGNDLRSYINRTHQLDSLRSAIRMDEAVWNDTMADMVIMQEITNQFYSGDYHKEAILILLDSLEQDPVTEEMGSFASQVRNRLSSLMIGHRPPPFILNDLEGNPWSPELATGRYLYLVFCSPDFYGCMVEYPFLQSYLLKHGDYLEVVTVMVADKEQEVREFMDNNSFGWKALYFADHSDLLDDYQVRAFPMAYLIGPDGTIVLSPATLPSEGFEQQLFRIMRSRGEI